MPLDARLSLVLAESGRVVGGTERVVWELATRLPPDRYDVTVWLAPADGVDELADSLAARDIRVERVAEVERILATADVCVSPDPLNPLNDVSTMNKVLEYMACGRPIVAYDLKEHRYSAGEGALYARPNSEQDLAARILELLNDPERRRRMGEYNRARFLEDRKSVV